MDKQYKTRQTLLSKIVQPDNEKSWEEFTQYYRGYIYAVIRNLGVKQDLIPDLLQDVLVKVWKSLPNYEYREGECTFRTWLCLVIKSIVYNFYRKKSTRNNAQNTEYDAALHALDAITEPEINIIAEKEWKIYVSNLAWNNVKDEFPKRCREIFEASLHEASTEALAQRFDITESSVRVYKSRVKKVLLREMSRLNHDLGA